MSSETLTSKNVITKKPHQCNNCCRTFPSNTKMSYWAGKVDGDFNSVYACMPCVAIMNAHPDPDGDGYPEGFTLELLESFDETRRETPEEYCQRNKLPF